MKSTVITLALIISVAVVFSAPTNSNSRSRINQVLRSPSCNSQQQEANINEKFQGNGQFGGLQHQTGIEVTGKPSVGGKPNGGHNRPQGGFADIATEVPFLAFTEARN